MIELRLIAGVPVAVAEPRLLEATRRGVSAAIVMPVENLMVCRVGELWWSYCAANLDLSGPMFPCFGSVASRALFVRGRRFCVTLV